MTAVILSILFLFFFQNDSHSAMEWTTGQSPRQAASSHNMHKARPPSQAGSQQAVPTALPHMLPRSVPPFMGFPPPPPPPPTFPMMPVSGLIDRLPHVHCLAPYCTMNHTQTI